MNRFIPKTILYKKVHLNKKNYKYISKFNFKGSYNLISLSNAFLEAKHIELIRRVLAKLMRHKGIYWINIMCNIPITEKSLGVRMGKGKGTLSYWVSKVRPGDILCNIAINESLNKENLLRQLFSTLNKRLHINLKLTELNDI